MKKLFIFIIINVCFYSAFSQNATTEDTYRRSSLYTLMISDNKQENSSTIEETFVNAPIPDKYNDHIIGARTILKLEVDTLSKKELKEAQNEAIVSYLTANNIAKAVVAKWFNRSSKGGFNMDLISKRGSYNASELDINIAKQSERGLALVADAGEELINNTFILVNNFKYTNKEEVAKKAKGLLSGATAIASSAGVDTGDTNTLGGAALDVAGKGYVIKTDAYLYKLVWNEEIAATFYNDYWTEDGSIDEAKKQAFDNSNIFKLEYIGTEPSRADLQSTGFTTKSNQELIAIATIKAVDAVIAKLQRSYEVFRTKTPLLSGDPISAKIGLKEGLEKGDKFEVLEQIINDQGKTEYKSVGTIKVEKDGIWDNRYLAEEENPSEIKFTTFSGSKNKYFQGMLIRQIN